MVLVVNCPGRAAFSTHMACCRSALSFLGCFCLISLGGQTILIRADMGNGWIGRKRTGCMSWFGLLSGVYKQGARPVPAARETVVPVGAGREGLGALASSSLV